MKRSGSSALVFALTTQLAQSAAGVVGFLVVARVFGPVVFADYVFGVAVAGIFGCVAQNALREPVILAKVMARRFFLSASVLISLAAGVCCGLFGLILQLYLPDRAVGHIVVALAAKAVVDGLIIVPYAERARERQFMLPAAAAVAASVVSIGLLLLLIGHGGSILSLPISQAVGGAVAFLIYWLRDRNALHVSVAALKTPAPGYFSNWLRISMWQLIEYANGMFDRLYSGQAMPKLEQGVYGFGRRLNDLFFEIFGGTVSSLSLPLLAAAAQDKTKLHGKYFELVQVVGVFLLGAIGLLFCLSDHFLVDVFGAKWTSAVTIYQVFLLMGVIQTFGYLQASLIRGVGATALWTRYVTVQAIANVLVILLFSSKGALALAIAIVAKTYLIWIMYLKSVSEILGVALTKYVATLAKSIAVIVLPMAGTQLLHHETVLSSPFSYYSLSVALYTALWALSVFLVCRPAVDFLLRQFGRDRAG